MNFIYLISIILLVTPPILIYLYLWADEKKKAGTASKAFIFGMIAFLAVFIVQSIIGDLLFFLESIRLGYSIEALGDPDQVNTIDFAVQTSIIFVIVTVLVGVILEEGGRLILLSVAEETRIDLDHVVLTGIGWGFGYSLFLPVITKAFLIFSTNSVDLWYELLDVLIFWSLIVLAVAMSILIWLTIEAGMKFLLPALIFHFTSNFIQVYGRVLNLTGTFSESIDDFIWYLGLQIAVVIIDVIILAIAFSFLKDPSVLEAIAIQTVPQEEKKTYSSKRKKDFYKNQKKRKKEKQNQ